MTKERLRRYMDLKREKEQLEEKLLQLETALYFPRTQQLTGMPTAHSGNSQVEAMVINHMKLLGLYREKVLELSSEMLEIEKAISDLDSPYRRLMRYRYLDGLKWEDVCVKMHYSWRQTHRSHAAALRLIEKTED